MSWAAHWLNRNWHLDGHPHERDEHGFCGTCGAQRGEGHYACVKKSVETRIEYFGRLQVHRPVKG